MTTSRVLIVGGSSGIGLALAELLLAGGAQVNIAGRSADRLAAAAKQLAAVSQRPEPVAAVAQRPDQPERLRTCQADITCEDQVRRLLADAGQLDHIVVTAADATGAYAPLADFDLDAARAILDTKLLGPWLVAKHAGPYLTPGASITFTSGIAAYRPGPGASMIATANGALEALSRALAMELAPIRVNVVSPGWIDTPIWDTIAGDSKAERLAAMAARLPVGRIGAPVDVAEAFVALMRNGFITGTLVHVDGGHRLI
jgi:NAD(P)-dependent dehydrogenase (short-subunit alcohol dehydrogenase family)